MKITELIPNEKLPETSGIYTIYCPSSEKAYIGQSKLIKKRWSDHLYLLKANKHTNIHLQRTYNKYGKDSLLFIVLENGTSNLDDKEAYFLSILDPEVKLNLQGVTPVVPCSQETKEKIRKSNLGKPGSNRGKKHSEATKTKMSLASIGKPKSEEHRKKISEAIRKRTWKPTHRKGAKMSEESKRKISEKMKEIRRIQRESKNG